MNVMTISLRSAFAVTVLAGCFAKPSEQYACIDNSDCTGGRTCGALGFCVLPDDGDGGIDMPDDTADACTTFDAKHFDACDIPDPTMAMSLAGPGTYVYDTSNGSLLDLQNNPSTPTNKLVTVAGTEMRVISVESFSLPDGAILRVKGTYPLVIASWSTIDLGGRIDANSTTLLGGGPGAAPIATPSAYCATRGPLTQPENGGQGGGGGAGGSMQSAGGSGGLGAQGSTNENGGTPSPAGGPTAPLLAAGCPGQTGGNGRNAQLGGVGGLGGGAVQLTAKTSLTIASTGRINASGAGGRPGTNDSAGGGGGGAGGQIGLEAPTVTIMGGALLAANGAGGAQGGGSNGTPGAGQDGVLAATPPASGGSGGSGGGGGAGSTSTTAASNGNPDGAGGGGGGGGAGYITIRSSMLINNGTMSPPVPITIP